MWKGWHDGVSLSRLRSNKIGCLCDSYRVHRVSASRLGCHACRASAHLRGLPRTPPAAAYQRRLICPLAMGCDHSVCAARSPTLDRNWLEYRHNFPHVPSSSSGNAGRVGCCRCRSARALGSSDCASFSWVLMGKLLLVQVSRGKYSRLLLSEVGLRRASPSPECFVLQTIHPMVVSFDFERTRNVHEGPR